MNTADRVAQLEAQVEMLREALKPFAYKFYVSYEDDPREVETVRVTVGQMQRAVNALAATDPAREVLTETTT